MITTKEVLEKWFSKLLEKWFSKYGSEAPGSPPDLFRESTRSKLFS